MPRKRYKPEEIVTLDLVYHPDRLTYPMRRDGERGSGRWRRISWDEALDEIAGRLAEIKRDHGTEAIAPNIEWTKFTPPSGPFLIRH
jgi:anaerobic selenocysteine-containing dehydrogenase